MALGTRLLGGAKMGMTGAIALTGSAAAGTAAGAAAVAPFGLWPPMWSDHDAGPKSMVDN